MPSDKMSTLVASTAANFQIAPDVQAVSRISDHIRILKAARELERDQQMELLRALSRRTELAKSAVTSLSSPSKRNHTERMLALDREKFALAKTINELESAYHSSETTLARLNNDLEKLRSEDVLASESSAQQDSTILLLKVYRSLGVSLESDDIGGYSKAVVRSQESNDMHVLNMDKSYSNFFIANHLWSMM
ncbi:Spc24 subunit of Ndc80-domain-containing protein [Myxozyma melibiosi]|uniref:Kinetochore protein Spc24 n=1 Tax=Myxozyma melibiosi TaxID=54550 RepID=A0ABR1FB34_9ASCO